MTNKFIWDKVTAVLSLSIIFLISCSVNQTESYDSPNYIHFTSPDKGKIPFEFDYPRTWAIKDSGEVYAPFSFVISLYDPLISPTMDPNNIQMDSEGLVALDISYNVESDEIDKIISHFKDNESRSQKNELKNITTIKIDGLDAYEIEWVREPADYEYPKTTYVKLILFIYNHDLIRIFMHIPNDERYGDFEEGYNYLMKSFKIIR